MKLILLLILISYLSFAEEDEPKTIKNHPYYSMVYNIIERFESGASNSQLFSTVIYFLSGKSSQEIASHYKDLVDDVSDSIENDGSFGAAGSGHSAVNFLYNDQVVSKLEEKFPKAIKNYIHNESISWKDWESYFSFMGKSDPVLAIKGLLILNGHTRRSMYDENIRKRLQILRELDPKNLEGFYDKYGMGSLEEDAFGLSLKRGGVNGYYDYGTSYKVIPGITIALHLFEKGYSKSDAITAINRANLIYETADLLYDHIGIEEDSPSIYSNTEDVSTVDIKLRDNFKSFLKLVKNEIEANPSVLKSLVSSLLSVDFLNKIIPDSRGYIDYKNDFILTMLLLNQFTNNHKAFMHNFDEMIDNFTEPERKKIIDLFYFGKKDIKLMEEGAKFTFEKCKDFNRQKIKWNGLIEKVEFLNSIFSNRDKQSACVDYF